MLIRSENFHLDVAIRKTFAEGMKFEQNCKGNKADNQWVSSELQSWVSPCPWSERFCKVLKLPALVLFICQLGVQIYHAFKDQIWCPICTSAINPISQALGYLALCLWLPGEPNWCGLQLQMKVQRVELCALTLSPPWMPCTVVASYPRTEVPSHDLLSLISYLTSSLHFLLLTLSPPCPDL